MVLLAFAAVPLVWWRCGTSWGLVAAFAWSNLVLFGTIMSLQRKLRAHGLSDRLDRRHF